MAVFDYIRVDLHTPAPGVFVVSRGIARPWGSVSRSSISTRWVKSLNLKLDIRPRALQTCVSSPKPRWPQLLCISRYFTHWKSHLASKRFYRRSCIHLVIQLVFLGPRLSVCCFICRLAASRLRRVLWKGPELRGASLLFTSGIQTKILLKYQTTTSRHQTDPLKVLLSVCVNEGF